MIDYPIPQQATHKEICDGLRRHYEEVSTKACASASGIRHAIDAYEREPALQQAAQEAAQALHEIRIATRHPAWAHEWAQVEQALTALKQAGVTYE